MNWKTFILYFLLSSLKQEINLTIPLISDIINVGAAHWELLIFVNTPILINLSISFLRVDS